MVLAWALSCFSEVETIGFDYGQRHAVELTCRKAVLQKLREGFPDWSSKLGDDRVLDLSVLGQVSDTAMTRDVEIKMGEDGLPTTFVPGRNLLFLTLSAAVAYRTGCRHIASGVCETDYSGYPDCREETIKAMETALNLGMASDFVLETPLMWIDKAATWKMASELGGNALVDLIVEETHTCYLGDRSTRHDWGYGCGTCPACDLRAKGWGAFQGGTSS